MKLKSITYLMFIVFPVSLFALESYYCPQGHGYVKRGMNVKEVTAACGEPISRQDANNPVVTRVPVNQLIYNFQGTDTPFYWYNNLFAPLKTGFGGVRAAEINIVDDKVKLIRINGSNSNEATVCKGVSLKIGDTLARVYSACGSPSIQNNSFINQVLMTTAKPQIWIYQLNEFQPKVTFTFVDGTLDSIN